MSYFLSAFAYEYVPSFLLQRNLKIMVNMGLSAKQEKDNMVQLVKREVAEMIKTRIPLMKSKVILSFSFQYELKVAYWGYIILVLFIYVYINMYVCVYIFKAVMEEDIIWLPIFNILVGFIVVTTLHFPFQALELQGATSDDFQDISVHEKEAFKKKYSMDDLLEDKICDLYDLYVEVLTSLDVLV